MVLHRRSLYAGIRLGLRDNARGATYVPCLTPSALATRACRRRRATRGPGRSGFTRSSTTGTGWWCAARRAGCGSRLGAAMKLPRRKVLEFAAHGVRSLIHAMRVPPK